jgi:hypothetical protein
MGLCLLILGLGSRLSLLLFFSKLNMLVCIWVVCVCFVGGCWSFCLSVVDAAAGVHRVAAASPGVLVGGDLMVQERT